MRASIGFGDGLRIGANTISVRPNGYGYSFRTSVDSAYGVMLFHYRGSVA